MKVCNKNWEKINITPTEIKIRDILGVAVEKENVKDIAKIVDELLKNKAKYSEQIEKYFHEHTFNHGVAAEKGAKYILKSLIEKSKREEK